MQLEPGMAPSAGPAEHNARPGDDPAQPPVVQVGLVWGETLLDARTLSGDERTLEIGDVEPAPAALGRYVGLLPVLLGCGWGAATGNPAAAALGAGLSALGLPAGLLVDELRGVDRTRTIATSSDPLPSRRFTLVERVRDEVWLRVAPRFRGQLSPDGRGLVELDTLRDDRLVDEDGAHRIRLPAGGHAVVVVGDQRYFVRQVPAPKRVVPGLADGVDLPFLMLFVLVGAVGLMLGTVVRSTPLSPDHGLVQVPDRLVSDVQLAPPPEPPKARRDPAGDLDAGEGARPKGAEGRVGREDAQQRKARGHQVARQRAALDRQIAESSGLLADLLDDDGALQPFGDGGPLIGGLTAHAGGVIGSQYGSQYGSGGLGSRGAGLGGNGTGELLGGFGARSGGRGGAGDGAQGGWIGVRRTGTPSMSTEDPILVGALDKSQIDRVIKMHLSQIRYCYERELNRDPRLQGKVVLRFVIGADGTVCSARIESTSMDNAVVENCLCERMMRLQFPEPRGRGIVIVRYPFVFRSI